MFIRILRSSLLPDYVHELQLINQPVEQLRLADQLNPSLTLKFGDLSPEQAAQLVLLLKKSGMVFWESRNQSRAAVIASFLNWQAVEGLIPELPDALRELGELLGASKTNLHTDSWEFGLPTGHHWKINRPLLMGILNVTPDSFSDGGRFLQPEKAIEHALQMEAAGADLIDIGAESTRPGAEALSLDEEWRRLEGVLKKIIPLLKIPVSIDTYKAEIARRALASGVSMVNDISGLTSDSELKEVVAKAGCPLILMHIKGTPRDMQQNPFYRNVMEEIFLFFQRQAALANRSGIRQLILDPGIGFGKRLEDNLELIRRLSEFRIFGYPVLLGPSRKSFIGKILNVEVGERLWGTAASVALAIANGARLLRVHDVIEMKQVVELTRAIQEKKIQFPDEMF
jgi:dihydropteroate synthase